VPLLHLAILALVQGITEFLPISSSGHLVLVPVFLEIPDQGLILDVAVHVGTLAAVVLYLWRDLWNMLTGISRTLRGRSDPGAKMAAYLIAATLPVIAAGYALNHYYPDGIRSVEVIGWATLGFGLVLMISDQIGMTLRRIEHLHIGDALFIGFAQVLALIPGTSRSGICMTAARILGMERSDAARFAMLLSIPVIVGAGSLKGFELWQQGNAALSSDALVAAGMSFVAALITIALLMAWLRRATFTPFAIYRVILGAGLIGYSYGWVS
jgi:undecaprenyl-diphosphatase